MFSADDLSLLENRNSRFVNRALPAPPPPPVDSFDRGNYEDIDDSMYSAIPADAEDYLQPVSHPPPLPITISKPNSWTMEKTESYVMVYANTDVLLDKDRPALTVPDGFGKMAVMLQLALHQLADGIFRKHCPSSPHFADELLFNDFGVGDSEAVLTQGCVCMYRVRQAKVQPYNALLMVSQLKVE